MTVPLPRVTIGVPVYNGAATLSKSLESIDAQTFRDFIVVISDNASTDLTRDIIDQFARGKENVHIISRPNTVPAYENFFSLALEAQTEFFVWLADDDWWEPDFLQECVSALDQQAGARGAFTDYTVYYHFNATFGAKSSPVPSLSWDPSLNFIIRSSDMVPSAFYGVYRSWDIKEALRQHSYNFDFSDVFLTLVIALRGMLAIVPRDLYRAGVKTSATVVRRSLDGSTLKYWPFLKAATALAYEKLPKGRATLAVINLWWRVIELRRHNRRNGNA